MISDLVNSKLRCNFVIGVEIFNRTFLLKMKDCVVVVNIASFPIEYMILISTGTSVFCARY